MKRIPSTECPKCGCTEIGRGYHLRNGAMIPYGGVFKASAVMYEICTNCGYVIAGYVDQPELFVRKETDRSRKNKTERNGD